MTEKIEFELDEDDFYGINIMIKSTRKILSLKALSAEPESVVGLGLALDALEKLPIIVKDMNYDYTITYRDASDGNEMMKYVNFTISEYCLEISTGGSVYDPKVGSDSFGGSSWCFDFGGNSDRGQVLFDIEETIEAILGGQSFTLSFDSDMPDGLGMSNNDEYDSKMDHLKNKIIRDVAENHCKEITKNVIDLLKGMKAERLSGDDTILDNIWEEVCTQVQYEESFYWEIYLETIRDLIRKELVRSIQSQRMAIWLNTEGYEYLSEEESLDYKQTEVVEHVLFNYVLSEASDYTNKRIETYLYSEDD